MALPMLLCASSVLSAACRSLRCSSGLRWVQFSIGLITCGVAHDTWGQELGLGDLVHKDDEAILSIPGHMTGRALLPDQIF